jgi:hypothetical protein
LTRRQVSLPPPEIPDVAAARANVERLHALRETSLETGRFAPDPKVVAAAEEALAAAERRAALMATSRLEERLEEALGDLRRIAVTADGRELRRIVGEADSAAARHQAGLPQLVLGKIAGEELERRARAHGVTL